MKGQGNFSALSNLDSVIERYKAILEGMEVNLSPTMENMEVLEALLAQMGEEHLEEIETAFAEIERVKRINDGLMRERDDAIIKLNDYLQSRPRIESLPSSSANLLYRKYSVDEIRSATQDFSEDLKVGEGEYSAVYRAEIEGTLVAVKIRKDDDFTLDHQFFRRQMNILRDIRHPHVVRVVGECSDKGCIMSEYMVKGSLADHLYCKNGFPPLLWHVRLRIATEICSALYFLHSLKPNGILHCDLKPENILLDEFYSSKISDVGMARLLPQNSLIKGSISYMDPDYHRNGEFTEKSDVYSLGIIVLQLLTGQPAFGLVGKVAQSLKNGQINELVDPLAGEWPDGKAVQLAYLAIDCTMPNMQDRPNLHPHLTKTLDKLQATTSPISQPLSIVIQPPHQRRVPDFFTCPITQELMDDPYVAGDGFTYELKAIKEWFDSGHNTSPMTNLGIHSTNLLPNHSLKSAIQEWKEGGILHA